MSATVPGNYEVYCLPYNPPGGNFDDAGTYFTPADSADSGMTGRQHPSAPAMWRFWDAFGIQDAEMLG